MRRFVAPALAVLIVNAAYLAAFSSASIFYETNVLLHLALGLALCVVAIRAARRYPRECGAFLAAAAPAVYLVFAGNTADHRWVLWLHITLSILAIALIALYLTRSRDRQGAVL